MNTLVERTGMHTEDRPSGRVERVVLDDEAKHELQSHEQAEQSRFTKADAARYKIEVYFASRYSILGVNAGVVTFWESGTTGPRLESDRKVYLCPGRRLKINTCEKVIPCLSHGGSWLLCPSCQTRWSAKDVTGELLLRLPLQLWAKRLVELLGTFEMNADIMVRRTPINVRSVLAAQDEAGKASAADQQLDKARDGRIDYIYRRDRMIKDTAAGADLLKRIEAFLKA